VTKMERNRFGWASGGKFLGDFLLSCKGVMYEVWGVGFLFRELQLSYGYHWRLLIRTVEQCNMPAVDYGKFCPMPPKHGVLWFMVIR
jgi:hypothetical protein